jgi:hypothetical protein
MITLWALFAGLGLITTGIVVVARLLSGTRRRAREQRPQVIEETRFEILRGIMKAQRPP